MRIIILFVELFFCQIAGAADAPVIAVASNMTHVMTDIVRQFEDETNVKVRVSFGSSGNFTRQILQGAPYQLFLSADRKYTDLLVKKGVTIGDGIAFARGSICAFIPDDSSIAGTSSLSELINILVYGQYHRIAIANPEYAPYGRAAQQAMQKAGLWVIERDRLLIAENAAQAAQFTLTGSVDVGFIPTSFSLLPDLSDAGKCLTIPESWHEPIEQYMVLINGAGNNAKNLLNYLSSRAARTIISKYGYSLP